MGRVGRHQNVFYKKEEAEKLFAVTKDENLFIFAQIHRLQSDFITKRTNILVNSEDCLLGGFPTKLFNYTLRLALLQVLLRPPRHALHRQRPGMYMGQFIYCGRHAMLSIDDVPPLRKILEFAIICNVGHHAGDCGASPPGHPGTTPSSSAATLTMAPPPGHPGTTPSSSAVTPTTASGQGVLPTEERPQRMTVRSTMLGTL